MKQTYLAFDLGAESGRGIPAHFDGETICLEEGTRFSTAGSISEADRDGVHRWEISRISSAMTDILYTVENSSVGELSGVAIDTWGVDFGLLDKSGTLLANPVWYRDHSHTAAMRTVVEQIGRDSLWNLTGVQPLPFNTLFQLAAYMHRDPSLLSRSERLLFMPDLLASTLIDGNLAASELTIASTSQMLDPHSHHWHLPLLDQLGLPTSMLQPIVHPATKAGTTKRGTPVYFAPGHDTASAVAAVPANENTNWAYISSGTWSLVGVVRKSPELSLKAFELGLSNEIGVDGVTRLLKNVMGLWLVQEIRRSLNRDGETYSYEELTTLAETSPSNGPIIDATDQRFLAPTDMVEEIRLSCLLSGQKPPDSVAALVRCALDSLALAYRRTLRDLEQLLDQRIDVLHIVGGGSKNGFLNQLAADACGIPVVAGPSEATAAGNVLCQLVASGAVADWNEAKAVCIRSFSPTLYEPALGSAAAWNDRESNFLNNLTTAGRR